MRTRTISCHRPCSAWVCSIALFGIALVGPPARAADAESLLGPWTIQDGRGVVAIEQCGEALCGRIVGVDRAPGEPMPTDVHGASECGLTIITNERPIGHGDWLGEVTDPRTGKSYRAKLRLDRLGNLQLRGFVAAPLFGRTQTWRRYAGLITPDCGLE
jgi:uncharacterized protein (DUF2147 family)